MVRGAASPLPYSSSWVLEELLVVVGFDVSWEVTFPLVVVDHVGIVRIKVGQEVFAVVVGLKVAMVCLAIHTVKCVGPLGKRFSGGPGDFVEVRAGYLHGANCELWQLCGHLGLSR